MSLWKKIVDNFKLADTLAQEESIKREIERAKKDIQVQKKTEKKPRKPKITKTPKEIATEKGEPYINVLTVELDKKNLGNGSFELDWNDAFIKELRAAGYPGKTDEDVVDMWFRSICRNVLAEAYEQEAAQKTPPDNVRYINRKTGEDGRTEVS
jgi:hypothetical protein